MAVPGAGKKIIWAVDPFEQVGAHQRQVAGLVRCLRERMGASVQPVHVLSPAELNLSAEFAGPWVTQYQPAADKALDYFVREIGLEGLEDHRILIQTASSTTRTVDALAHYATEANADLIVVSTHGRTGMSRFILGSFAETLLTRSRIPVLVAGAHMRAECDLRQALFPTDFGDRAKATFKRVVALARELESRVLLYHAIPRPIEPVYQSGVYLLGSPWIPVDEYFERELGRHRRHAETWARWAKGQGVETEVVIDSEAVNISESIAAIAKRRAVGWIAMEAHTGPIASALLGSVTRQVVRIADAPVWVMHWPRKKRREAAGPRHSDRAA